MVHAISAYMQAFYLSQQQALLWPFPDIILLFWIQWGLQIFRGHSANILCPILWPGRLPGCRWNPAVAVLLRSEYQVYFTYILSEACLHSVYPILCMMMPSFLFGFCIFFLKDFTKWNVLHTGLFETLPGRVQCEMLLKVTEQCFNTLERSEMLLLLLRRFPETVVQHGVR